MTGIVDDFGRALVRITVRHPENSASAEWDAWIDTGFTGELLLTPEQVEALNLPHSIAIPGALADGSRIQFETRHCFIEWFGVSKPVLAIMGTGRFALIGIRLLEDLIVAINYPARSVSLLPGTASTSSSSPPCFLAAKRLGDHFFVCCPFGCLRLGGIAGEFSSALGQMGTCSGCEAPAPSSRFQFAGRDARLGMVRPMK